MRKRKDEIRPICQAVDEGLRVAKPGPTPNRNAEKRGAKRARSAMRARRTEQAK